MANTLAADTLVRRHVRPKDRVLLINPPVEETRYSWIRWSQPLDLLKIGSFLRTEIGCDVALLDFLRPNAKGDIEEKWLPRDRRYHTVGGHRYPMRHYGKPFSQLRDWVDHDRKRHKQQPTHVWITSLCTFWHNSTAEMCRVVRSILPDASISLFGQYPRLLPKHAATTCAADYVITKALDTRHCRNSLDLYGTPRPQFVAVQAASPETITDIKAAVERGVYDIAFFEDDLLAEAADALRSIVEATEDLHRHLRYHFLSGIDPKKLTPAFARLFSHKKVAQVHFEEAGTIDALDLDVYREARRYLGEATDAGTDKFSGFVWIGRPKERLECLVRKTFQVLDAFGNLILKPFSPTPGSCEHTTYRKYLDQLPLRHLSPHFFPFAELNGITRHEYHDLYRMAAFLNEKIRDESFDFLQGTLGADMLRESLRKEAWKLEASPLRVVD